MQASYIKPLLPLRDIVIFPSMVVPLFVGREKSIKALQEVMKADKSIVLVTQKNSEIDDPSGNDLYQYGCLSKVLQLLKLPDGTVKVLVEGIQRASINVFKDDENYLVSNIDLVEENNDKGTVVALREIGDGKMDVEELTKSGISRLRKEPDEIVEEQEVEEISNDNFEKEYKGEVSKSGVAILPSKRMRKVPIQNASSPEDKKEEIETALKLTEEVKTEIEDKPLPTEEEKK